LLLDKHIFILRIFNAGPAQVGRQSSTHFAAVDQVPKCLQAKQLTLINRSCFSKRNRFLLLNSYHNLCMHPYDTVLIKIIALCHHLEKGHNKQGGRSSLLTFTLPSGEGQKEEKGEGPTNRQFKSLKVIRSDCETYKSIKRCCRSL